MSSPCMSWFRRTWSCFGHPKVEQADLDNGANAQRELLDDAIRVVLLHSPDLASVPSFGLVCRRASCASNATGSVAGLCRQHAGQEYRRYARSANTTSCLATCLICSLLTGNGVMRRLQPDRRRTLSYVKLAAAASGGSHGHSGGFFVRRGVSPPARDRAAPWRWCCPSLLIEAVMGHACTCCTDCLMCNVLLGIADFTACSICSRGPLGHIVSDARVPQFLLALYR